MDKNAIKKYAVWARNELIARMSQKAQQYGITAEGYDDKNADSVNGVLLSATEKKQRQALIAKIDAEGFEQVMEEVAYTWFNRFTALRFMEVNNYLPSHTRVFTNEANEFKPQILADAISLELEGLDMDKVFELKNANKDEELYKYLLIVQCNALSSILPGMFQKISDYTELLLPDYLLRTGSTVEQMITNIPESDWTEQVEIIGWLYQYYINEPKDVLINARKKYSQKDVPFVTQLFTTDWIVQYMVDNTVGRLWLDSRDKSDLPVKMKYYLKGEIKHTAEMDPINITCIDPCCGSGHILCCLFDRLISIYEDYGYTSREAARLIVENNIYGLDIDTRAAQMAYFSLMMKARQYDRRFFNSGIQPSVYAIKSSSIIDKLTWDYFKGNTGSLVYEVEKLINSMKNAEIYGSLTKIENIDFELIDKRFEELQNEPSIYNTVIFNELQQVVCVAKILSKKYMAVVTNPPYMNASYMPDLLKEFVGANYDDFKSDLFAAFVKKSYEMCESGGHIGLLMPYVWMFISSYEKMRNWIIDNMNITSLVQLEYNAFEAACVPVAALTLCKEYCDRAGQYVRLSAFRGAENQGPKLLEAIANPDCGYRYETNQKKFKEIPTSVIGYWAGERIYEAYQKGKLLSECADIKQGLKTGDNDRFLRLWFEIERKKFSVFGGGKWFPCNKGGDYRRWYGNNSFVINWENDGFELKNFKDDKGKLKSRPQNLKYMFREGLTYTNISSSKFGVRYCPEGFAFDAAGSMIFIEKEKLYNLLGFLSSDTITAFTEMLSPTMSFEVGQISAIPYLYESNEEIEAAVKENIQLAKADWDDFEVSWDFMKNPLLRNISSVEEAFLAWQQECINRFNRVKENEAFINGVFSRIYGNKATEEVNDSDITINIPSERDAIQNLISYSVGCMFGRYSMEKPGVQIAGPDELQLSQFAVDSDNIIPITDDEYFNDDIVARFVEFIKVAFGQAMLEQNLQYIATVLGGKGTSREIIRSYFINEFYQYHCNMYSVTGSGKRPIYWLFDSGKKNGFKCLIYMHRYQPDTIARIRTDYVHEQQSRYRTVLADLEQRINSASTSERVKLSKQLKTIQDQAEELRKYEEKIHHLADQMISIDLDDGVKENYAMFQDVLAKIK